MSAVSNLLSYNVYPFPANGDKSASRANMNPPINPSNWIFCLNSFKQYSPLQNYVFSEDRDFKLKSCEDAILNNLHCHEDVALYIVGPSQESDALSRSSAKDTEIKQVHQEPKQYLTNILKEARILSHLVPKSRTVNYLHISKSIKNQFDPVEMTELMFNLSKSFGLRHDGSGRYVIEIDSEECDDNEIALIKGLGFNNLCIDFPYNKISQMPEIMTLVRDYDFQGIHTRVHVKKGSQELSEAQISAIAEAKPDSICIFDDNAVACSPFQTVLSEVSDEHSKFQRAGYDKVNSRRYVHQDYKEIWCIHDLLSIGLGGTNFIDNIFTHNADQLDQYYDLIANEKLPFVSGGYIKKKD